MSKPIYVLGTGTSHDGSSCLLKDGKICAAIEKERITRKKHDGGNDTVSIEYCLEKENITLDDVDLIVQNSTSGEFEGPRIFENNEQVPVITIPHHLAHAFSAYGASSFDECAVFVLDSAGSPLNHCTDRIGDFISYCIPAPDGNESIYKENNSYYRFDKGGWTIVCKEASRLAHKMEDKKVKTYTENSIGDFYAALSIYCFRSFQDSGKLMGLAPYGNPSVYNEEAFTISNGAMLLNQQVFEKFATPSESHAQLKENFQHYADIANWAQRELERAIIYLLNSRYEMFPSDNLAYCGGVALNAVMNSRILKETPYKRLYIQPAASDNGAALGCAYYGWLNVLKQPKAAQSPTTCFGKVYSTQSVRGSLQNYHNSNPVQIKKEIDKFFKNLKTAYRKDRLRKDNILIQVNIKDAGVYQIGITQKGMKVRDDIIGRPTCQVSFTNTGFYDLLQDPSRLEGFFEDGKITVTDYAEFFYLLDLIEFGPATENVKRVGPEDYLRFIHYEGEGYIEEAARLLSDGKIIGWFQGESEFGPRALGRRSILADPRKKGTRDFINGEIKFREDFRPFAPSVLREDVQQYFQEDMESPYMLMINKIRPEWKDSISEVVHADGTCRVQTVTADWNPEYYRLLSEFKRITGISVLLNTSFNGVRMPIVETPDDAIRFFYSGKLDYLVMQDVIVKRVLSQKFALANELLTHLAEKPE
jgi:predicted NodU family carbamoyl transferase